MWLCRFFGHNYHFRLSKQSYHGDTLTIHLMWPCAIVCPTTNLFHSFNIYLIYFNKCFCIMENRVWCIFFNFFWASLAPVLKFEAQNVFPLLWRIHPSPGRPTHSLLSVAGQRRMWLLYQDQLLLAGPQTHWWGRDKEGPPAILTNPKTRKAFIIWSGRLLRIIVTFIYKICKEY